MCLRRLIKAIDAILRRREHIYVFDDDPENLLRISRERARTEVQLSDGVVVHRGDPVCAIHYWNEHIPEAPAEGETFSWGLAYTHRLAHSFRLLAAYMRQAPELQDAKAITAEGTWGSPYSAERFRRLLGRWGFDVIPIPDPPTLWGKFVRFWEHVYSYMLVWAYDPGSLAGHPWHFRREALWMSRSILLGGQMHWARTGRGEQAASIAQTVPIADVES